MARDHAAVTLISPSSALKGGHSSRSVELERSKSFRVFCKKKFMPHVSPVRIVFLVGEGGDGRGCVCFLETACLSVTRDCSALA